MIKRGVHRVIRGGSYYYDFFAHLRTTNRDGAWFGNRYRNYGFRVVIVKGRKP